MAIIRYEYALDNHVYRFEVILSDNTKIHYQLAFERDLYADRTNVTLLNFFQEEEDNSRFCVEIKKTICECFYDFFEKSPNEKVYFELELGRDRSISKLLKFYRWSKEHNHEMNFQVEIVDKDELLYASATITKI